MNNQTIIEQVKLMREHLPVCSLKSYKNRVKCLKKLKANIISMQDEICDALKKDLNKSKTESYMAEVGIVLNELSSMIKHCKKYSKPKRVKTPLSNFPAKSYRLPCPYGLVLVISPWNYPFLLSLDPLLEAVSAGNSVILKPSKSSPNVSLVIEKLVKATFNSEEVFVVMAGREECDALLDQEYDYIFYTGSTNVGKMVMEKASKHFTPVTLEMGGKSPCIVDETASIKLSAKRIVFGKLLNCGQTCVAPDFLYCHKSIKDELINEIINQINIQYTTSPLTNESYPKMINLRQFKSVASLIDKDRVIYGGNVDETTLKIEPTIINSDFTAPEMQQEIFGPILPVVTFESIDEVINKVNSMSTPLALYYFSNSKKNQNKVTTCCNFGGGCINDTIMHIANNNLGFGGLKQSGLGAYHGKIGFETFSHYKSIIHKRNWLDLPMRYQPHTKFKDKVIRMFLK